MLVVNRKNLAYLITIKYSVERSPFPMRFRCFWQKLLEKTAFTHQNRDAKSIAQTACVVVVDALRIFSF